MARGKHESAVKSRRNKRKAVALVLSLVLVFAIAAGGTLAYVVSKSDSVNNRFEKAYVTSSVSDGGVVTNTGNVDAYIRAYVVVNWMDNSGNVYAIRPDYSLSTNAGWAKNGEFYYYTSVVPSLNTTTVAPATVSLAPGCEAPSAAYSLSIEVVAEAIQAEGYTDINDVPAYQDAWKISSLSGS